MILLGAHNLTKSFGARPLFTDISLVLEEGERVALIGPNGAGKSTLLKILAGQISPDSGSLSLKKGLTIGYLEQDPSLPGDATVDETVDDDEILARFELGPIRDMKVGELSGGWKKRVALAKELARRPDLLLLDEPTNHLDVESILWLEEFLARATFGLLTITHDRLFLQRIANRVVELDVRNPGGMFSVRGDYAEYVEQKAERMAQQEQREEKLRNRLRRETEWLRRGAKARTTKQQARIYRAGDLKDEVEELQFRNRERVASLDFGTIGKSPKKLIEAKQVTKTLGGKTLFKNLDLLITPKSRIGLLGRNGCGKSTLIRTLLGEIPPDHGTVFVSDKLQVAYFEQTRESLDPNVTVAHTLAPRNDGVNFRGQLVHIKSYLGRFLFRAEQMDMKVGKLSGGERSRLLIARLMLREANLLVLDEPTNDLDTATLDVLEDCLVDFDGAVLLVTHDRYFLDQVASEIISFHPYEDGKLTTFAGLAQWESWHASLEKPGSAPKPKAAEAEAPKKKSKLGYMEQRELDGMEAAIAAADKKLGELQAEVESPANATNASKLAELYTALGKAQETLDGLYERWAELEKKRDA